MAQGKFLLLVPQSRGYPQRGIHQGALMSLTEHLPHVQSHWNQRGNRPSARYLRNGLPSPAGTTTGLSCPQSTSHGPQALPGRGVHGRTACLILQYVRRIYHTELSPRLLKALWIINHHFVLNEETAPFSVWLSPCNHDKWKIPDR